MDKGSLLPVSNLVSFLIFFLLCDICYKSQAIAYRNATDGTRSRISAVSCPGSSLPGGLADSGNCDPDKCLPCAEKLALRDFLSPFATPQFIPGSNRPDKQSVTSFTINCTWEENFCHISDITMRNLSLNGRIRGDAVAQLTYLKTLDLSSNEIQGSIPENLSNLTSLTELYLGDNQLTGPIPKSLGLLKNLTIIDLSLNYLDKTIPPSLGNLTSLLQLNLGHNQLTGPIPRSLGLLKNLTIIDLHLNYLDKTIPPSLGNLTSLVELNLWSNKLSGQIPSELRNLTQLQLLFLDDNELSGELPPDLGMLSNLKEIGLTSNKLRGTLPKEYALLRNLQSFELGGNNLSGTIPPYIAKWDNLTSLILMGNNFEGELPPEIFNMKSLQWLMITDLRNSSFEFPHTANLINIYYLVLRNCSMSGLIPPYVGNWSQLEYLDLSFNNLTGEIPDSFRNLSLSRMFLTGNMLNGTIPRWICKIQKGDLSYNKFDQNGKFPCHPKINIEPANRDAIYQIMDKKCDGKKSKHDSLFINAGGEETIIGQNHYDADNETSNFYVSSTNDWAYSCSGDFPWPIANSTDYIKSTTCGVSVPEAPLYAKARLCPQALTYYGFCLHNGNYTVKLHFAETVYAKEDDHSITGKRVFDIYIQGNLALKDFNIKEKAGAPDQIWTENFSACVHDNLLDIHFFWAGEGSLYNTPYLSGPLISAISVTPGFKVGGLSSMEIVGIVIAAISAPLLLLAFMWRMGWVGDRELRVTHVVLRGKSYSLKEIKDATRKFSTKNEIGKGRFGTVYKADLADQIVAVKKLSPQAKHVIDQIGTELYVQEKSLNHDNLVELLDHCSKGNLHLLIYEHMENGSLQRALFGFRPGF